MGIGGPQPRLSQSFRSLGRFSIARVLAMTILVDPARPGRPMGNRQALPRRYLVAPFAELGRRSGGRGRR
jgi:hypothetical protein